MLHRSKLVLAALAAAACLAALVGSASAAHLSTSETRFRVTWSNLEFKETVFGIAVKCPVTLEGSYHSATIAKTAGTLVGYVNRASVNSAGCTGGHATVLNETLPWHVTYESFEGPLPEIRSITQLLSNASFRLEIPLFTPCLSRAENTNGRLTGTTAGNVLTVTTLTPGPETIPCREAGGRTVVTGTFASSGNVTTPTGSRISVSLI